eukprot:gene51807-70605_t
MGEFTHADAGQMNVYLNYYKENEAVDGDNAPIGIILCAGKNENLVKYATAALDGSPVEFKDEVIGQGGMKDVYFSPDKSYVVAFFRDKQDAFAKD